MQWVENSRARETIAELTEKANEQHYEVSLCHKNLALFINRMYL